MHRLCARLGRAVACHLLCLAGASSVGAQGTPAIAMPAVVAVAGPTTGTPPPRSDYLILSGTQ